MSLLTAEEIYTRWGDEVATVPLGRSGLKAIIEMDGIKPRGKHTLEKVLRRVKEHGGPSTSPPTQNPDSSSSKTYIRERRASMIADIEDVDVEELDDGPEFEPVQIDHGLIEYDEINDAYRTYVSKAKAWVKTSGDAHRAIIRWYSNWDGAPVSLNGISRRTGLPRNWVVGYLKAHGITHDSAPFSAEEVARRGVDDMAQDALALKFGRLATKTEELGAIETQKAARNWWDFEHSVLDKFREWIADTTDYSVPRLRMRRSEDPYWLVTSATDFHWGMRSWDRESGYEYNRKIARRRLMDTTESLISRLPGQPEGIIVAVGSDWIHCDGLRASTTRGTPVDVDGSPLELLITGAELAKEHIDLLSTAAPVRIVLMAGNHDRTNAHALLLYLRAIYENSDRVTVLDCHHLRTYQEVGKTLMCFTHGDSIKVNKLGPVMAKEQRDAWGRAKHHVAFGGHLHHQRIQEIGGIRHYLLPSLASPDAWHAGQGYITSAQGLMGIVVDLEDGPTGTLFCPIKD
tara:strand:+ start:104 stop:1651 length:1548 start_codon:yes stop_codon:yes gene_type:complete